MTPIARLCVVWRRCDLHENRCPLCAVALVGVWNGWVFISRFSRLSTKAVEQEGHCLSMFPAVSQMWYVLWSGTSDPLNASQLCSVIHSKIHCDHDVFWSFLCEGSLICYLTAPAHKIYDDLCSLTIATSLMMLGAGPFIWRQEAARDATRGFVSGGISSARSCKQQPIAGRDKSHPFWNGFSSRRCFTMCLDTWTFEILAVS